MKHCLRFIACMMFVLVPLLSMGEGNGNNLPTRVQRETIQAEYHHLYETNPAMLPLLQTPSYSWIGASVNYSDGELHHPLVSGRELTAHIETESFLRFEPKGWMLHGRFVYENGFEKDGSVNLSHGLKRFGTPAFFISEHPASRWNIRQYALSASVAKNFGRRWTLGLWIDYVGHQHFRTNDVRNKQTELDLNLSLCASWRMSTSSHLAFGVVYARNKEKPVLSNLYSAGKEYAVYLVNGMGTYLKNMANDITWNEHLPGAILAWKMSRERWSSTLGYTFRSGENYWQTTYRDLAEKNNKWTRYRLTHHEIKFEEKFLGVTSRWLIAGQLDFVSGKGKTWEKLSQTYTPNYEYQEQKLELWASWQGQIPVLREVKMEVGYTHEKRLDKSYDYRFSNSQLRLKLRTLLDWKIGRVGMSSSIEGGVHLSGKVKHSPSAADTGKNVYCELVGKPLAQWLGTDVGMFGANLQTEIPIRKCVLEVGLTAKGWFSMSKREPYEGKNFLNTRFYLNVYF